MDCCFNYIGFVRREDNSASRNSVVRIVIKEEYVEGLKGVEEFSHLIIIYHLHLANLNKGLKRVRGGVEVGVFATRSQHRPNPIGISVVELIKREGNTLYVKGINAFDGTPVLDIKPYDEWDSILNPKVPEWHKIEMRSRVTDSF
ncbi:tRNA (N6-threonylcarbamoyladenosine(37)-N6)-methyltransferase TrmO [Acidianus infernus]|uniref:tRNA (N6-threonylcarbamoyladenosine(37)-N6)-methyltransferase TrmO n=1 Tax=Acidianus infernus TaxID=12915 RepID=A0A6A9QJ38_ACIIN|nr:tRNA (N6-threonylcarbamoyladenosine(37)-N6)-methyltransferase TrmO [Acidianus infernus]MUM65843.1 tRNA (N6-threonylcarbamoyladenosine(37)-N6)-methyltransferase TrmO [Acidianus infernus]